MFPFRRGHGRGYRGHGRQPGIAMLLLAGQLMQVGFDRIPPVTLVTLLGQVAIFLNPLRMRFPNIGAVCISGVSVWYKEDWQRLVLAPFFHLHEWHLYYNMVSFLWKGISLEKKLGSTYFAYLIAIFAVLTSSVTVALGMLAENVTGDLYYIQQCAAGFSGVLFALKVVTTHMMPPGVQRIMGMFPVNSRIACWVELVVIHLLVPNSSFMGHLSGILIGLLYVKGPLKLLMDQLHAPAPSYTYTQGTANRRQQHRPATASSAYRFSGTSGYTAQAPDTNDRHPAPSAPAFDNDNNSSSSFSPGYGRSPTLPPTYDDVVNSANSETGNRLYPDLDTSGSGGDIQQNRLNNLEELRQRRLARLDR